MMFDSFGGSGVIFGIFPVIFMIVFLTILGVIIYRVVLGAKQWKQNNDSPVLTVDAKVVTKRSDVSYQHNMNSSNDAMNMGYSSTTYYVTFEVQSGDRMELRVPDTEYGMLTEGDKGSLTFQGTRYLSYARDTRI